MLRAAGGCVGERRALCARTRVHQRKSLRLGHRQRHCLFRAGSFQDPRRQARTNADAEGLDRPDPSRRPAAVQIHAGGTSQGQHAAVFDGVALSRRRWQLALGAAGRHRGARARWPSASHGWRGRRHHRGQEYRRGDDRVGRSVESHEPFDVRAADRARHTGSVGDAALRFRRRVDLPSRERSLSPGGAAWAQPREARLHARPGDFAGAHHAGRTHRAGAPHRPHSRCRGRPRLSLARSQHDRELSRHARRAVAARGRADRRHDP